VPFLISGVELRSFSQHVRYPWGKQFLVVIITIADDSNTTGRLDWTSVNLIRIEQKLYQYDMDVP